MVFRLILVLLWFSMGVNAQQKTDQLSSLQVVRKIDSLLIESKLEAAQAGRSDGFVAQVNIAKSFVHAHRLQEAKEGYQKALNIAWNRSTQEELLQQITHLINQFNPLLYPAERPQGMDENYALSATGGQQSEDLEPMDKYTAGTKIDAMLSFLSTDIITTKADQLMLLGKLADCRYLVSLELFDKAEEAYHSTIIRYLDPRWTSQLLGEISMITRHTMPELTPSETTPNMTLNMPACLVELDILLKPIALRFGQNQAFQSAYKAIQNQLLQSNKAGALAEFEKGLMPYVPEEWMTYNKARFEAIMMRTPSLNNQATLALSTRGPFDMPHNIVYYSEETEGLTTETLRILEERQWNVYRKITHPWGGVFYFLNDESTKDTEWIRVFKRYENQKPINAK